jgi:citrate lyase alpha subunit
VSTGRRRTRDELGAYPPAGPAEFGKKVVAPIKWVDGTVIDCVREVEIRNPAGVAGDA